MKLKVVIIDLELTKRQKQLIAAIAIPSLILAGGAIAYASVPVTWNPGDSLTSKDLNDDFSYLDTRISNLAIPRITEWVPYSPSTTDQFDSSRIFDLTATGFWRRVGDSVEIESTITSDGTETSTDPIAIGLPAGQNADVTKLSVVPSTYLLGFGSHYIAASSQNVICGSAMTGTQAVVLDCGSSFISPSIFKNGDTLVMRITVPISSWTLTGP